MLVECGLLVCSILFAWFIIDNYFPKKKYPPGPTRLPLVGNALLLLKDRKSKPPFVKFEEWSKKYGPVCYVRLGIQDAVIVDDFEMAKQLLHHEVWVDRPFNARVGERSFGKPLGIIFVSGDGWKEMRRFSMRTLRDFGYGKQTSMQTVLDMEVKALLNKLDLAITTAQQKGTEPLLPVKHLFTMPVLNILWSMVSNIRTDEDDIKLEKLISLVDNLAKANPIGGNILGIFPFLRYLFPEWTGYNFTTKCHVELQQYFRDILEERRQEGRYLDDKRDFIDMFIQEIDRHEKQGSNPNFYTDEQFITTITDLFEAGSETSSNTMEFAIYYVMKSPSVQEKIQEEIDRVVGHSRYPDVADMNKMPYTEATLMEVQRMSNVLPMSVRCPTEDCKVGGYDIAKGTFGIVNMYSIHMDPTFWGDPWTFRPERFLDDNMKIIPERASRVIPFGAGKRVCLGEQMARTTIFVYFASVLQTYKFLEAQRNPAGGDNFRCEPHKPTSYIDVGFTLSPKPYTTKIIKRE